MATDMSQTGISVQVLGRTVLLSKNAEGINVAVKQLQEVQDILQKELNMHNRLFEIFDASGMQLRTDADLREAIRGNQIPFSAMLKETSVHFLEAKQEALAQMQWKMLRDRSPTLAPKSPHSPQALSTMNMSAASTTAMDTRVLSNSNEGEIEQLRKELLLSLEAARGAAKADAKQLSDRITAGEATNDQISRSVQGLRDAMESSTRSSSILVPQMESMKSKVVTTEQEVQKLIARLDDLSVAMPNMKAELFEVCKQTMEATRSSPSKAGMSGADMSLEASSRLAMLESQFKLLHMQLLEQGNGMNTAVDNLRARADQVSLEIQHVRSEESSGAFVQQLRVMQSDLLHFKESQGQGAEKLRNTADQVLGETNYRFDLFNECCSSLQAKILDKQQGLDDAVESIQSMLRGVKKSVEEVLTSDKMAEEFGLLQKLQNLEQTYVRAEQNMRDSTDRERRLREEEMKKWREALLGAQVGVLGPGGRPGSIRADKAMSMDRSCMSETRSDHGGSDYGRAKPERGGSSMSRLKEQLKAWDEGSQHGRQSSKMSDSGMSVGQSSLQQVNTGVQLMWDAKPPQKMPSSSLGGPRSDAGSERQGMSLGLLNAGLDAKVHFTAKDGNIQGAQIGQVVGPVGSPLLHDGRGSLKAMPRQALGSASSTAAEDRALSTSASVNDHRRILEPSTGMGSGSNAGGSLQTSLPSRMVHPTSMQGQGPRPTKANSPRYKSPANNLRSYSPQPDKMTANRGNAPQQQQQQPQQQHPHQTLGARIGGKGGPPGGGPPNRAQDVPLSWAQRQP